jgi:hypothetical protein
MTEYSSEPQGQGEFIMEQSLDEGTASARQKAGRLGVSFPEDMVADTAALVRQALTVADTSEIQGEIPARLVIELTMEHALIGQAIRKVVGIDPLSGEDVELTLQSILEEITEWLTGQPRRRGRHV